MVRSPTRRKLIEKNINKDLGSGQYRATVKKNGYNASKQFGSLAEARKFRDKVIKEFADGTFVFEQREHFFYVLEGWKKTEHHYVRSRKTVTGKIRYEARLKAEGKDRRRKFNHLHEAIAFRDKGLGHDKDICFTLLGRLKFEYRSKKRVMQMSYGDRSFGLKKKHIRALIDFLERFERWID